MPTRVVFIFFSATMTLTSYHPCTFPLTCAEPSDSTVGGRWCHHYSLV